ncbi:hypothetical protein CYMTET_51224 [Cymbomonas tetramitiformis]|uniref:Uncharacterized protein n=1 Tax=Cymbomonas tetramitiformis TaxID=36881 RepID=A0AAE0BNH6_9CHLO|nr:hypothetical protein CYMTET_51224 [Cymbomonas tetramitiformis]
MTDRFDVSVAKHGIRKCFPEKHVRFGGNEHGAAVLFAKLVPTIKEAFVNENALFVTLFDLEDVTTRVRAEANKLLFSTLELIYDPTSPATDWLEASAVTSPHDAKRKNTLDQEEVKGLFIDALDKCFAANVKAGMPSDLSAATLAVDTEGKSAIADLTSIILDLQRQVKSVSSRMDDTKNFTPRGAKTRGKMTCFAARDLPAGGNWSQAEQKKQFTFHKGSGEFIPFCANDTCALESARHWHRDCPNCGKAANKREFGSHNFNVSDFENDMYVEQFQCAMEEDDSDKFNALCFLVGGELEICDELSAYSFGITAGGAPSALGKYAAYCQPVDTSMGGFHVGGAADGVPSFTTVQIDHAHFDNQCFADIIARGERVQREELAAQREEIHLRHAWMIEDDDGGNTELLDDIESDEDRDTETVYDAQVSVRCRAAAHAGVVLYHPPSARR